MRLGSFNFRNLFIRHRNFLGELTEVRTDLDKQDAEWHIVRGLADPSGVSLESANFPNHFLRHQDFRLKLHERPAPNSPDDALFREDATFFREPGLANSNGMSFRSVNFPDRYIRHRDFHLFVEPKDSPNLAADATFFESVLFDEG